jgi:hypothetical protein
MTSTTHPASARGSNGAARARSAPDEGRRDLDTALLSVRAGAEELGRRVPGLLDGARAGAAGGTRLVASWPEDTRRAVASFSMGLGAGLIVAGAPRLLFVAALLPALAVASSAIREGSTGPAAG